MHALDVVGQGAFLGDFLDEGFHLLALAHHLELHGAVGQILHGATDFEAFGKILGGVAEADALNAALENHTAGNHGAEDAL